MRPLKHLKIMVKKRRRENESGKGKMVERAIDAENRNNVRERAVGNTEKLAMIINYDTVHQLKYIS